MRIYVFISVIVLVEKSVCKRYVTSLQKHDRDAVLLIKIRYFAASGGGGGVSGRGGGASGRAGASGRVQAADARRGRAGAGGMGLAWVRLTKGCLFRAC